MFDRPLSKPAIYYNTHIIYMFLSSKGIDDKFQFNLLHSLFQICLLRKKLNSKNYIILPLRDHVSVKQKTLRSKLLLGIA